MEHPEGREHEPQDQPSALDIVKIDGRWVQVLSMSEKRGVVRFLGDETVEDIEWHTFELVRRFNTNVGRLADVAGEPISPDERSRIHLWADPKILQTEEDVDDVRVFGEYRNREKSPETD